MEKEILISDKMQKQGIIDSTVLEPSFAGKTLNIEITSACNENCIYCYFSAKGFHKKANMINEQFFYRITKEAFELGITDVGLYMTAEPLMNTKIYDYISYLKKIGFEYVYISTNGILCTPENLRKLASAGIDSIKFSVSAGTKENFIKHHGIDAFDKVKRNIEYAYSYRKENNLKYKLYMYTIITKFNCSEKNKIKEIFGSYVDELVFLDVLDGPIKLKGLEEFLMENKNAKYEALAARTIPCAMLFNRIVIDEKGYICICCDSGDSYTRVMDIKNMSLKDAVYSDKMKKIRKMHIDKNIKNTICNHCAYGVIEKIKPFETIENEKYIEVEQIDIENEIKKRFNL